MLKKTKLQILKADHGDCLLIRTYDQNDNEFNILIDGGTYRTFQFVLKSELKKLTVLHLVILTHIHSDHIEGMIAWFKSTIFGAIPIERFWINGANLARLNFGEQISYKQGKSLENLLIEKEIDPTSIFSKVVDGFTTKLRDGLEIDVLSPTISALDSLYKNWPKLAQCSSSTSQEVKISAGASSQIKRGSLHLLAAKPFKPAHSLEYDKFNTSSIAFILKIHNSQILFLADSRPEIIVASLRKRGYDSNTKKLKVDYIKIAHHGSLNNTSCELLDLIDCNNFIISTNGGNSKSRHPDREVIARIIYHPKRDYSTQRCIYFNYPLAEIQIKSGLIFDEEDLKQGNWTFLDDCQLINL